MQDEASHAAVEMQGSRTKRRIFPPQESSPLPWRILRRLHFALVILVNSTSVAELNLKMSDGESEGSQRGRTESEKGWERERDWEREVRTERLKVKARERRVHRERKRLQEIINGGNKTLGSRGNITSINLSVDWQCSRQRKFYDIHLHLKGIV